MDCKLLQGRAADAPLQVAAAYTGCRTEYASNTNCMLGFSLSVRPGLGACDERVDVLRAEKAHKRIAALDLVNQQMKVYFRLNTIRLSAALVSAVEGTRAMPFESFPASARVTYKYYTGRIAVFDENFVRPCTLSGCAGTFRMDRTVQGSSA